MGDKENKLIEKASKGHVQSFELLMDQYIKILYNYILVKIPSKEDAEDVFQETFICIWSNISSFNQDSSFKTWTIGIARRKIADFYRKYYKNNDNVNFDQAEDYLYQEDPSEDLVKEIDLEKSISNLKPSDRELLYLIFNAQLSYSEIEGITGIPKGTIKSRVFHIKNKLKPMLDERRMTGG